MGNVISKIIEVKKIDSKKPTVTLRSGSNAGADTVYIKLTICRTAGGHRWQWSGKRRICMDKYR